MTTIVPTPEEYADNVRSAFAAAREAVDAAEQACGTEDPLSAVPHINSAIAALRGSIINVRGVFAVQRLAASQPKA